MESIWRRLVKKQEKRSLAKVQDGQKHWKKHKIFRRSIPVMIRFKMKNCQLVLIGETLTTTILLEKLEIKQHVALAIQSLSLKLWNQD